MIKFSLQAKGSKDQINAAVYGQAKAGRQQFPQIGAAIASGRDAIGAAVTGMGPNDTAQVKVEISFECEIQAVAKNVPQDEE